MYFKKLYALMPMLGAVFIIASPVYADVIDDAYRVCEAMEGTELTTKCEVKGWGKSVDVRMDTNGTEARKICAGTARQLAQYTQTFKGEWKLRIFSPYSGDQPIAVCKLY